MQYIWKTNRRGIQGCGNGEHIYGNRLRLITFNPAQYTGQDKNWKELSADAAANDECTGIS